jgi:medium-chain acyl-CoA synthetase
MKIILLTWLYRAWFAAWNTGAALFVRKLEGGFSPGEIAGALHRYPITTLCAGPTAFRQLVSPEVLAQIARAPPARLEHCVAAGEALERAVIQSWRAATGIEIKDGTLRLPTFSFFFLYRLL